LVEATTHPARSLDFWRNELATVLAEALGNSSNHTLSLLCPPKPVADDFLKVLVQDSSDRRTAVALCSNPLSPDLVARGMRKAKSAKCSLGRELGCVILDPIVEGRFSGDHLWPVLGVHRGDGLSYSVLPYRKPFSDNRLLWRLQRRRISSSVLGWLSAATKKTARALRGQELEENFVAPLRHLAGMKDATDPIRRAAADTCNRIHRGHWQPRHVLMHNDLWKDNILIDRNPFGFVLIDWPGSRVDGYGIYDLLRLGEDIALSSSQLRRETENHCRHLSSEIGDARSHLLAALAELSTRLEHFPVGRFVRMATDCLSTLERMGI